MAYYASKVLNIALGEEGYLEKETNYNLDSKTGNAGDGNYNKYARDFDKKFPNFYNGRKNGFAWCDIFVDWCLVMAFGVDAALKLLGQPLKSCGAGCSWSAKYYKQIGCFYTYPKVGDQIFFKDSSGDPCHTGLVYKVTKTKVHTIEGNTSSAKGVVANGGAVARKSYDIGYSRIYGYGRPKYDAEPKNNSVSTSTTTNTSTNTTPVKVNTDVKEWQEAAIKDGFKFPKYGADNEWGSECESVATKAICKYRGVIYRYKNLTKIVQKAVGVKVDGKFGKDTKTAVIAYQGKNGLIADGEVGIKTWKKILGVK